MAASRAAPPLLLSSAAAASFPVPCRLLSPRRAITAAALSRQPLVLLPSPPATGIVRSALTRNGTERLLPGCAPRRRPAAAGQHRPPFGGGPLQARAFSASPLPRSAAAHSLAPPAAALAPATVGPAAASGETAGQAAVSTAASTGADAALPPLEIGDLADMGLASWWTPVGHIQHLIEWITCTTGLPFWAVVPLSLVAYKVAILPALLPAIQSSERYAHIAPALLPWTAKLRAAGVEKHAGKQNQAAAAIQQLFAMHKVDRMWLVAFPIIEGVCSISSIWAVRQIINLPVPQLTEQSMFWVSDLTSVDPTHGLPFAVGACVLFMNEWKRMHTTTPSFNGKTNPILYAAAIDLLPLTAIPMCWNVSSGILVGALSTMVVYNLQHVILANPAVRRALNIPLRMPVHPSLRRKRFWTLIAESRKANRFGWSPQSKASR